MAALEEKLPEAQADLIKLREPFHCWQLKGEVLKSSSTLHATSHPNPQQSKPFRPLDSITIY